MREIFLLIILIGTVFISCSKDDDNNNLNKATCNSVAKIVTEEEFKKIVTTNYVVSGVKLNDDCLEITVSSSGCDSEPWEMSLYSVNAFYTIYPLQRAVKIELINNQGCLAVFQKTISFDLTPFQISEQNEVPLNIEGWSEQIIYEY